MLAVSPSPPLRTRTVDDDNDLTTTSMDTIGQGGQSAPQDIVAIFHTSFHPTKGNVVDWCLKASDDLSIEGVEFSTLPSGLHLVDHDVVYFAKDVYAGVSVFRRHRTTEHGQRGFRLSALGVLLARSPRPRPWLHVETLKALLDCISASTKQRNGPIPTQASIFESFDLTGDWEPARAFFEARMVRRADLCGAGQWKGWDYELENPGPASTPSTPILHLPYLLRLLGPSALTLYKHVLGRRRILIYTSPPVEPACLLCYVAADMCFEVQRNVCHHANKDISMGTGAENGQAAGNVADGKAENAGMWHQSPLKGRCQGGITVLGMVTLSDLDKIIQESKMGRGWIACTTDAIFLEKPSYYDLIVDLTTSTPKWTSCPTLYLSKPTQHSTGSHGPTHRLSLVRFTWSDVRLWGELDRILQLDAEETDCQEPTPLNSGSSAMKSPAVSPWADMCRVYEDVCLLCASLWIGSWRSNSTQSYSTMSSDGSQTNWGRVQLEDDDDLSIHDTSVRTVGLDIEGRPTVSKIASIIEETPNVKGMKRTGGMSVALGRSASGGCAHHQVSMGRDMSSTTALEMFNSSPPELLLGATGPQLLHGERFERQIRTIIALLHTLHANACFQLSKLAELLPLQHSTPTHRETGLLVDVPPAAEVSRSSSISAQGQDGDVVYLTPRDMLSFELGPLSSLDTHYLEWLAEEYGGGCRIVVKRSWKDLIGTIFGFG